MPPPLARHKKHLADYNYTVDDLFNQLVVYLTQNNCALLREFKTRGSSFSGFLYWKIKDANQRICPKFTLGDDKAEVRIFHAAYDEKNRIAHIFFDSKGDASENQRQEKELSVIENSIAELFRSKRKLEKTADKNGVKFLAIARCSDSQNLYGHSF